MKKTFLRNLIIFVILMILVLPYNYFVNYFATYMSHWQFAVIILYALTCGIGLKLMDLSDRRVNAYFAILTLAFIIIDLFVTPLFTFGASIYFFFVLFGSLVTSIFIRKTKR